ncbi:ribosomal protection-like ABC-F family protein [Psychrobacillus soli]|uniref:ABC-F family ATP-binding cassette domain-containing protein n=1 Tax=Psychrobacillus soli TaxID=1543965 RepID=A0A544TM57_9BACI|nr:ABC-F family ATP-binding cassette domain-containing protein [Psychrobacillus soli]TQR18542.1 ABC-F family ATP-binding cassette domain-containing protein [Psychrobacillus soli]
MICTIQEISKMLGGNTIFENLSLSIKTGDRLGIVGRNGTGKTTLFKLIARIEDMDKGSIHFKKGTKIGYLAQIPIYSEEITGYDVLNSAFQTLNELQKKMKELEEKLSTSNPEDMEKILQTYGDVQEEFTNLGGYVMESELDKVIQGLQLSNFVSQSFSSLSGGEQTKIMLGKLLLTKPDLLLLDEPTNHLDLFAVEWLEEYLVTYAGTVVIISHDRYFLDQVVTKVADLEEGELTLYHGNYSSFIVEKEERLMREFQEYEEQQKKIKKMREAIKRLKIWANEAVPPNAGLHRQARNMERALERMEKVRKPLVDPKKMNLSFEAAPRSGKEVVVMEEVCKSFDAKLLLQDANLHVYWKDRIAIVGRNGTGKSTILNLLRGEIPVDKGAARLGSNVRVGFLSQHFHIADPKARLIDVFRSEVNVFEGDARHILAKFMFYGPDVFKRVSDLSGGERMRLRLAQLMHQDINLLMLDEPTNHLDIDSREVLEDAMEDFQGTILAVSHDRYFLNKLFPRTAWLDQGELTTFEGPYEWARAKWEELQATNPPTKIMEIKETAKLTQTKIKQDQPVEEQIAALELEIEKIVSQIELENDWENYERLLETKKQQEQQLEKLLEKWMENDD